MLEKIEFAIKNGQSRDIGNIRSIRHKTNTNNPKNTTQKTKKINNTNPIKKTGCEPRCSSAQFLFLIRHPPCNSRVQAKFHPFEYTSYSLLICSLLECSRSTVHLTLNNTHFVLCPLSRLRYFVYIKILNIKCVHVYIQNISLLW